MKSVSIVFLCFLTVLLPGYCGYAQTYHYSREAIVTNGVKNKVSGDGHYLTFTSNGLYESNSEGFSQGIGVLKYAGNDSNGYRCYEGNGYLGENLVYRISSDYRRINVILPDKRIAVYVMTSPSGPERVYDRQTLEYADDVQNTYMPPSSSGKFSHSSNSSQKKRVVTCPACGGNGYIEVPVPRSSRFGVSRTIIYETCPKCGHRYAKDEGHNCVRCKVCHGAGTITE